MRFYLLFALITCAFGVAQLQAENARLKQSNEALRGALKAIQQEDAIGVLLEEEVLLGVGYDHVKQGCVNGANLIKYEDKSVDECGDLCDKRDDCVAFEYGVNYGGSGRYKARDCQLQSSDDYKGCSGIHHNLDLYIKPDIDYEHIDAGCVNGANIVLFRDTSISECAEMCDNTDECVAFEYGVARGGAGKYKSRDCQLQSSSNYKDCSGEHHNLDLYIKPIDVGYEKIDAGCVNGHNIVLYHHKTIPECAALCNANDDCEAFEYGVDYEGAGRYKGQDCQLQDSANYERCDGTHHNLDLYIKPEINYEHVDQGCVNGENLVLYKEKSIFECAQLCDQRSDCMAFEYGVNHGGDGRYKSRDCQLQSSDNYATCDGEYHNLDLYIKSDEAMVGGGANNCGGYLDFDELPSDYCSKMSGWAICGIGNGIIDGSGYGCKFHPAERRTGYCKTRDSGNQCNQFQAAENCPDYLDYEDLPSNWCSQLSRWAICGVGNGVVDGSGYGCKFHPAEKRKGYCKDPNYTNQCAKFVKSDNCNGYMNYAQLPSDWCSRLSPWAICGIGNGVVDGSGYGCEFFPDRSGYCKSTSSNDQCTAFLLSGAEEMLGATTVNGEEYCESDEMISNESGCKSSSCCHWNTWEEGEASFNGAGRCWSSITTDTCYDTKDTGYDHVERGCVNGANLVLHKDVSIAECADFCDYRDDCVAFEYGVNYGGSGKYKSRDCQLQSSNDYSSCSGEHHNLDLYVKPNTGYEKHAKRCVYGNNIIRYADKSVSECAELCNANDDCLAFEYGVNYHGTSGDYKARDCQLQSSANYADCSGSAYNLDLYIKPDLGYEHLAKKCVYGNNIKLFHDKSVTECAALCDGNDECEAFEYGVSYGGSEGDYEPRDCQLQSSANYGDCPGNAYNLDLYIKPNLGYERIVEGCVGGHNIVLYHEKSVQQCAKLCEQNDDCMAFEYGMNYGGKSGNYRPRDCQLQDSDDTAGCPGKHYNLDLYVKPKAETQVGQADAQCTYTLSGFKSRGHLNGVFVHSDEQINGSPSYNEVGADTILGKGHNGHWWFDDDIKDFEHDDLNPDGVWAWAETSFDINSQTKFTGNEWNGQAWAPVEVTIEKDCGPICKQSINIGRQVQVTEFSINGMCDNEVEVEQGEAVKIHLEYYNPEVGCTGCLEQVLVGIKGEMLDCIYHGNPWGHITDDHTITIPADAKPGTYEIVARATYQYSCLHFTDGVTIAKVHVRGPESVTWQHVGFGGCTGGNWRKIGTANSLDEAKKLMLADDECSADQSMLFHSPYSYDASWSVRCATADNHEACTENNSNWQEYILRRVRWSHVGYGGCTGGNWRKIGTAGSLDEAKALMLADDQCNADGSMLFYSAYSYDSSWSVRCATAEHHEDCTENNSNWQEYIVHM